MCPSAPLKVRKGLVIRRRVGVAWPRKIIRFWNLPSADVGWLAAGLLIVAIAFSASLVASVLFKRFERPETGHKFLDGLLRASGWHNTKPALCAKDHERRKKGRTRDGTGSRAQQTRINSVPFSACGEWVNPAAGTSRFDALSGQSILTLRVMRAGADLDKKTA